MAPLYDGHGCYKKMLELQEKLRKSEEERIRLEERFKTLVQESRSRHDACINRLRLRYIEFLEEQRTRDERNHKLLGSLDKVDSRLSLMTAKTDRLNVLRKQYEAYLLRVYANRGPPGSITGDSGIASQNEDRCMRRNNVAGQVNPTSPEIKTISSSRVLRSSRRVNQSASPCEPTLIEPTQSDSYDDRQVEIVSSGTSAGINYRQANVENASRMHGDTSIQRIGTPQFPPRIAPTEIYQTVQAFRDSDARPVPRNSRADPNLNAPYVMSVPQISSLSQQNVPRLNKSPTERMEAIQTMSPRRVPLATSEPTNGDITQYKSYDISRTQIAPRHFDPSPITQSLRRYDSGATLENSAMPMRMDDRAYSSSRGTPIIMESYEPPSNTIQNVLRLPSYLNYSLRNSQRPVGEIPLPSFTTSDVDDMMRRHEGFGPRNLRAARGSSTILKQAPSETDECRTTMILENELDRYIGKIRSLHRDLDMQSLEELDHEQNTSGDLLNVTLSDDDLELVTEDKEKGEQLPVEVEKVLALASDLASRSVDRPDNGKAYESENRNVELNLMRQSDGPVLGGSQAMSDMNEGRGTPMALTKDEISSNVAPPGSELEQHRKVEKLGKKEVSDDPSKGRARQVCESRLSDVREDNEITDSVVSFNEKITERRDGNDDGEGKKKVDEDYDGIRAGQESELEQQSFAIVGDLEPWNMENMEKQVKELHVNNMNADQATKSDSITEPSTGELDQEEIAISGKMDEIENVGDKKDNEETDLDNTEVRTSPRTGESTEVNQGSQEAESQRAPIPCHTETTRKDENELHEEESIAPTSADKVDDNERNEESGATDHASAVNQGEERVPEGEKEPNVEQCQPQDCTENLEQSYADLNQEYTYEQNPQYGDNQGEGYQEYGNQEYTQESNVQYGEYTGEQYDGQYEQDPNAQYQEDPNAQYQQDPNAQYEQDPNVQYEQDPNAQYEQDPNAQYEQDPNAQYDQDPNAQYEQDPNAQYEQDPNTQYGQDPNAQYEQDPNQQYSYNYDQQYDPNQAYETDPNESYAPTGHYDPEQANVTREQEEGEKPECEKTDEDSSTQRREGEAKSDEKSQEELRETDEPKKKKDVIKSLLDSDTETSIERNVSNTESDFDFN